MDITSRLLLLIAFLMLLPVLAFTVSRLLRRSGRMKTRSLTKGASDQSVYEATEREPVAVPESFTAIPLPELLENEPDPVDSVFGSTYLPTAPSAVTPQDNDHMSGKDHRENFA